MRVLLTGGSGYLGQHLLAHLRLEGHQLLAAYSRLASFPPDFASICHQTFALDLADAAAVERAVAEAQPDAVVHLAAISSPVACEDDPERAFAVNVPTALIDALPPSACVVFVSTDQVYDGLSPPYTEQSPTNPVNTYGRSKLAFEKARASARVTYFSSSSLFPVPHFFLSHLRRCSGVRREAARAIRLSAQLSDSRASHAG